jgi:molybdopterin synthase catalytic subunit
MKNKTMPFIPLPFIPLPSPPPEKGRGINGRGMETVGKMKVEIEITSQPIVERKISPVAGVGARAEFSGIVRGEENGQAIAALEYEAYQPMAERVARDIIADLGQCHPCLFVQVTHRIGVIPVGETAIHIVALARHRAEAFAMLTGFMNRLKQDVPIWKRRALTSDELAALNKS